eukprot:TRINITY_DN9337_c2_g1_i1.p1 TRINITY_DN9337_c2_g1~~TRINITY_DN9337_c2_g1_i1.p1  ORF type:complete len:548 (+),score=104.17 TRINITY_DN9337_c2_g1_i1:76-1644(+)
MAWRWPVAALACAVPATADQSTLVYHLVAEDVSCRSPQVVLTNSRDAPILPVHCFLKCIALSSCTWFAVGKDGLSGNRTGMCVWEVTQECAEGFEADSYDVYRVRNRTPAPAPPPPPPAYTLVRGGAECGVGAVLSPTRATAASCADACAESSNCSHFALGTATGTCHVHETCSHAWQPAPYDVYSMRYAGVPAAERVHRTPVLWGELRQPNGTSSETFAALAAMVCGVSAAKGVAEQASVPAGTVSFSVAGLTQTEAADCTQRLVSDLPQDVLKLLLSPLTILSSDRFTAPPGPPPEHVTAVADWASWLLIGLLVGAIVIGLLYAYSRHARATELRRAADAAFSGGGRAPTRSCFSASRRCVCCCGLCAVRTCTLCALWRCCGGLCASRDFQVELDEGGMVARSDTRKLQDAKKRIRSDPTLRSTDARAQLSELSARYKLSRAALLSRLHRVAVDAGRAGVAALDVPWLSGDADSSLPPADIAALLKLQIAALESAVTPSPRAALPPDLADEDGPPSDDAA